MLTRRIFGIAALGGFPLAMRAAAPPVAIGVATDSFHDLPRVPGHDNVAAIVQALKETGATEVELASENTEAPSPDTGLPPPPPPGPYGGPPAGFTLAELAARRKAMRQNLRQWRLATKPECYAALRAKFDAAGVSVFSLAYDYDDAFTGEETEAMFGHAKAMGVSLISARASLAMARRLVPFAKKHNMLVAFRNDRETQRDLVERAGLSPQFRLCLDIGNFTAANQEAVAFLQEHHERISHLILRDRTRDGGGDEQFGAGDTPIRAVMALVREKQYPMRAFVDYEYVGLGTPQQELRKCLAWLKAET